MILLAVLVFFCVIAVREMFSAPPGMAGTFVDDNVVPVSTLFSAASTFTTSSAFDDLHVFAHGAATATPTSSSERKHFDDASLLSWERGDGGLHDTDRILLAKYYNVANSAFEFGVGESTKIAAYTNMPNFKGVDSDPIWVGIARDMAPSHFRFELLDIGATEDWGYPHDNKLAKIPLNYMTQPLISEPKAFDFYLVDGRYRVACALISFLHALSRGASRDDIRVAIHDYIAREHKGYNDIEKWTDRVECALRLCVFKLKDGVTEAELADAWKERKFISA